MSLADVNLDLQHDPEKFYDFVKGQPESSLRAIADRNGVDEMALLQMTRAVSERAGLVEGIQNDSPTQDSFTKRVCNYRTAMEILNLRRDFAPPRTLEEKRRKYEETMRKIRTNHGTLPDTKQ